MAQLKFNDSTQNNLVHRGQIEDEKSRKFIRRALGLTNRKVEATKHTILSGPPGVGKTYGTQDECNKNNVYSIMLYPGMSDIQVALALAVGVAQLKPKQELVVIMDDADDVVFGSYETLNKWKVAMGDINYDLGIIPYYHHAASMTNTLAALEKQKKHQIIDAVKSFQSATDIGLSIPMDQVRFVILCNLDLEDPKSFKSPKLRSAVGPVLDRFEYKRMDLTWEQQWGWLSYVLVNSQPFRDYPLETAQKKQLLEWMYSNWQKLRSTSYRTINKLAADMINEPDEYVGLWREKLIGN